MNIQIFGTKKCNDTKKAERFFKERGIKYQFIDMKEKGIWSVKVVDLERLSVDMNFKLIIMRVKDHHSAQTDMSLL